MSRYGNTVRATVHLLCHDLSYIIGTEEPYWEDPPVVSQIEKGISDLSELKLQILEKIAEDLKEPENHLNGLVKIQTENPFIRL